MLLCLKISKNFLKNYFNLPIFKLSTGGKKFFSTENNKLKFTRYNKISSSNLSRDLITQYILIENSFSLIGKNLNYFSLVSRRQGITENRDAFPTIHLRKIL